MSKINLAFVILFFVLFPFVSNANPGTSVCLSMDYSSAKIQCLDTVNDGLFDKKACDVCLSMDYDSGKNSCVKIIKNRDYHAGATDTCLSMNYDSEKNSCLKISGKQIDPNKKRLAECLNYSGLAKVYRCVIETAQDFCSAFNLDHEILDEDWKYESCWQSVDPETDNFGFRYQHCLVQYRCK